MRLYRSNQHTEKTSPTFTTIALIGVLVAGVSFYSTHIRTDEELQPRQSERMVVLVAEDGTRETVPLESLSEADQQSVLAGGPVKGDVERRAKQPTLEPCTEEDGSGQVACYWDAQARGNGQGTSYIVLEGEIYTLQG